MSFGFHPIKAARTLFGYNAVVDKKVRTAPKTRNRSEDRELDTSDRRKLIATARDQRRNLAVMAWMIRKHLDYVSRFTFQVQTDDEDFNASLERLMAWWSRAPNCDVAGRHHLSRLIRLAEAHRTVDGDCGLVLLSDGRLQAIEGDRIAMPTGGKTPQSVAKRTFVHGVELTNEGRARNYLVCKRHDATLHYDKIVAARNMAMLGYYDRFDQVRGVSPLSSAIRSLQDQYESQEAALVKAKLQSFFGVAVSWGDAQEEDGFEYTDAATGETATTSSSILDFDIKPGLKLNLPEGAKVDMMESKTPSTQFLEFATFCIQTGLLALDLPMTFFDSRRSSYSAMRQDINSYVKAAKTKQDDIRDLLARIAAWKIATWARTEDPATGIPMLVLPRGMQPRDVAFDWVSDGIPFVDPLKEVQADLMAVAGGLQTRDDVCRKRYAKRYADVVKQLGKEEQMAVDNSATITIGMPGQTTTRDEEVNQPANETEADNA